MADSNRRIAANTLYLYARTVVVLGVMLYVSRVVLRVLGADDLGTYNVVGGIVALMAFVQQAQTRATSRFITYELGRGTGDEALSRVYSTCVGIHAVLALAVLLIAETAGLWIVNCATTIPPCRMLAANIVFQCSVLTFVAEFMRCPVDSVIIAEENMSVYAYVSIFSAAALLAGVLALEHYGGDCLVAYGVLLAAISLTKVVVFTVYKCRRYPAYRLQRYWNKGAWRQVLAFSGWTLLGSTANTTTQQGVALLFNNFVGLVANAALGFANQVNGAVSNFVSSFTTAFNPQVIKLQAQGDTARLHLLMFRASKFSAALCMLMALPLIANMDFLLRVWLTDVPRYTTVFCQLILCCMVIDATTGVLNTAITATGRIRGYQTGIAISFLLDFCCAFALLAVGLHPGLVFGSRILTRGVLNGIIGLAFARRQLVFPVRRYVRHVVLPIAGTIAAGTAAALLTPHGGWAGTIANVAATATAVAAATAIFIIDTHERQKFLTVLRRHIKI